MIAVRYYDAIAFGPDPESVLDLLSMGDPSPRIEPVSPEDVEVLRTVLEQRGVPK